MLQRLVYEIPVTAKRRVRVEKRVRLRRTHTRQCARHGFAQAVDGADKRIVCDPRILVVSIAFGFQVYVSVVLLQPLCQGVVGFEAGVEFLGSSWRLQFSERLGRREKCLSFGLLGIGIGKPVREIQCVVRGSRDRGHSDNQK